MAVQASISKSSNLIPWLYGIFATDNPTCPSFVSCSNLLSIFHTFFPPSLRQALLSGVKEIRAGAMRVLRYILTSPAHFEMMLEVKVDVLVARSLDTPPLRDIERLQAMRFIRQVSGMNTAVNERMCALRCVCVCVCVYKDPKRLFLPCLQNHTCHNVHVRVCENWHLSDT